MVWRGMRSMPISVRRGLVLLIAGATGLSCGGGGQSTGAADSSPAAASPSVAQPLKFSSSDATSQPTGSIKLVMRNMKYSPDSISVPSGRVVIYLVNAEAVPCGWPNCQHDVVITTSDKRTVAYSDTVEAGKTKVFAIEAMPTGKYSFHDDIGMHFVELNMSGPLDVI